MGEVKFTLTVPHLPHVRQLVQRLDPEELIPLVTRGFSEPHEIYDLAKQIDGVPEAYGTFPLAGMRAAHFLNQHLRQPFYESVGSPTRIQEVLSLVRDLRRGHTPEWAVPHVQLAFQTFDSIYTAPAGRVPLPEPGERYRGDHQVTLTDGRRDGGRWLQFQNWWGFEWGDEGLGYLSLEYLEHHMVEASLSWNAVVGPSLLTYPRLIQAPTEREKARIWMSPNLSSTHWGRHAGKDFQLVVYDVMSLADPGLAQVIQVRSGRDVIIGWLHVFHGGAEPRTSILKEFYIWPSFRRQGYGSILEAAGVERARERGSTRMQALFYEMDAQPSLRTAGERFGRLRGYRWRWRKSSRPNVEAIGEKKL